MILVSNITDRSKTANSVFFRLGTKRFDVPRRLFGVLASANTSRSRSLASADALALAHLSACPTTLTCTDHPIMPSIDSSPSRSVSTSLRPVHRPIAFASPCASSLTTLCPPIAIARRHRRAPDPFLPPMEPMPSHFAISTPLTPLMDLSPLRHGALHHSPPSIDSLLSHSTIAVNPRHPPSSSCRRAARSLSAFRVSAAPRPGLKHEHPMCQCVVTLDYRHNGDW